MLPEGVRQVSKYACPLNERGRPNRINCPGGPLNQEPIFSIYPEFS